MKVKQIAGTDDPEELVCRCARNDYREDGIIDYSFADVMRDIDASDENMAEVIEECGGRINRTVEAQNIFHYHDSVGLYVVTDPPEYEYDPDKEKYHYERFAVELEAKKRTLLDHLIDSGHWGPFEHPQASIAIDDITRVVTHQIVRHRHFTYDQQSMRVVGVDDFSDNPDRVEIEEEFQFPTFAGEEYDVDRGGVHDIKDIEKVEVNYKEAYNQSSQYYKELLKLGVPKEQARKVLPTGVKTNIVMSGNSRAWMHILNVRTKADVQGETRRCAESIFEQLKEWMPYVMKKYDEDVLPLQLNP